MLFQEKICYFLASELNFDDFKCKTYYSQTVRVLADQAHVHISRADLPRRVWGFRQCGSSPGYAPGRKDKMRFLVDMM